MIIGILFIFEILLCQVENLESYAKQKTQMRERKVIE